ncbi:unnamed protein product, partial [Brenthis ino]
MIVHKNILKMLLPSNSNRLSRVVLRGAHSQNITKNIFYISNNDEKVTLDQKTMKLNKEMDRPICIMLNWLQASPKQVMKYASIYLDEGFDVLRVSCDLWQLILPKKGAKVIGKDLINIMSANDNSYVVHGFSVGGYVWSEALVHAMEQRDRYQLALDRVEAQVWDSVADSTEVHIGVPLAIFPNNKLAQTATKYAIWCYLKAFKNIATVHYKMGCETYYDTPCRAPALFLLSSTDPVGNEMRIRRAYNLWLQKGIECTWQCWPDSAHVRHYMAHPEEYTALVRAHIRQHVTRRRAYRLTLSNTSDSPSLRSSSSLG